MTESPDNTENWEEVRAALAKRGVIINVLAPFLLLGLAYLLRGMEFLPEAPQLDEATHQLMVYILGAVALGDLAAAFYIKKTRLRQADANHINGSFPRFTAFCVERMTLVFALGASPAIYGFVLYALGGTIEQFIFFILISLVGYRLLRPGRDELEKLWTRLVGEISA